MNAQNPTNPEESVNAAAVLGPLVERIDHVGLAVNDLDAALAFYERAFGLHLKIHVKPPLF